MTQSLYLALRDAQRAAGGKDYFVTSFGKASPTAASAGNSHSYTFEFAPGDNKFKTYEYAMRLSDKSGARIVAGNIFRDLVSTRPLLGNVRWVWMLRDDKIHCRLLASKPTVCAGSPMLLKKGSPAKLAWLGDEEGAQFSTAPEEGA